MPIIAIADPADARLSRYANLPGEAGDAAERPTFIVEGRWCVQSLAASGLPTESVVVQAGREQEVSAWFPDSVPIYVLSAAQIRTLVGFDFHRGILACGRRPPQRPIEELKFAPQDCPIALAVLGVSQRDNLGSMVRTATSLGIDRLILGPRTADLFSRRAIRVSMGAALSQAVYHLNDSQRELAAVAKAGGLRTVVTSLSPDATPLHDFVVDERPIILVVGSEPDGVDTDVQSIATDRVQIPMRLGMDSLNVSVAAAIFMYDLVRRLYPPSA